MRPIRSLVLEIVTLTLGLQGLHCGGDLVPGTDAATIEDNGPAFVPPDASVTCQPSLGTINACGTTGIRFPCGLPEGIDEGQASSANCSRWCEGYLGPSRDNRFRCAVQPERGDATAALLCTRVCMPDAGTPVPDTGPVVTDTGNGGQPDVPLWVDGRKPEGFQGQYAACSMDTVPAYLLAAAEMEAASVSSFARLARELTAHSAPRDLVDRARQSLRDEVKHTRQVARLAARLGATFTPPETVVGPVRPLVDIALENVVEGCVRETYAALQAEWQGQRAHDPAVRATYRHIAEDEARHASLAWDVAQWIAPRLTADERARVEAARSEAIVDLQHDRRTAPPPHLAGPLGLPSATEAMHLLAGLDRALWTPAAAA